MILLFIGFAAGILLMQIIMLVKCARAQSKVNRVMETFKCKHEGETGRYCGTCGAAVPKVVKPIFPDEVADRCLVPCDFIFRYKGNTKYRRCVVCGNADKEDNTGLWVDVNPSKFPSSNMV